MVLYRRDLAKASFVSIVGHVRSAFSAFYDLSVLFVSDFIVAVLSQPKAEEKISHLILKSINSFFEQDDVGERIAGASSSVLLDQDRRRNVARSVGQDVMPMVSGFVGGMASSLRPGMGKQKSNNTDTRNSNSSSAIMNGGWSTSRTLDSVTSSCSDSIPEDDSHRTETKKGS